MVVHAENLESRIQPAVLQGRAPAEEDEKGLEESSADGTLELQWQTIRGTKGSNRCLMIRAGEGISLEVPRLLASTRAPFRPVKTLDRGEEQERHGTMMTDSRGIEKQTENSENAEQESSFTLCLDFCIELEVASLEKAAECMMRPDDISNPGGSDERSLRILALSEVLDVRVVVRRQESEPAGANDEMCTEDSDARKERAVKASEIQDHASKEPSSSNRGDGTCSVQWRIHAILLRVCSRTTELLCVQPSSGNRSSMEQDTPCKEEKACATSGTQRLSCVAGLWHSLAVVLDGRRNRCTLCVDGMLALIKTNTPRVSISQSPGPEDRTISIGGEGGQWATLSINHLAAYDDALEDKHVIAITRVFRTWRHEGGAAAATRPRKDERQPREANQSKGEQEDFGKTAFQLKWKQQGGISGRLSSPRTSQGANDTTRASSACLIARFITHKLDVSGCKMCQPYVQFLRLDCPSPRLEPLLHTAKPM